MCITGVSSSSSSSTCADAVEPVLWRGYFLIVFWQ